MAASGCSVLAAETDLCRRLTTIELQSEPSGRVALGTHAEGNALLARQFT